MNSAFTLALVAGLLGAGGVGSVLLGKLMPQRVSAADRIEKLEEKHDKRITDLEAKHAGELQNVRDRMAAMERRMRLDEDYIEELRVHISEGKGPPPPDWPEGLR